MKAENCLQNKHGPTPCFREVGCTPCSLDFCPASDFLEQNPERTPFAALHSHCVMSDTYATQSEYEEGLGEFIATIAQRSRSNR